MDFVGIYVGYCSANKKSYVGSSLKTLGRIKDHQRSLAKGNNRNKHLQYAYNKYGEDCFEWTVVARCEPKERFVIEQMWISSLRSHDRKFGFNRAYPVRTSEPNPTASRRMRKLWRDPEMKAMWLRHSKAGSRKVSRLLREDPKFAAKMSAIRKEMWTPETIAKMSRHAKKRYRNPEYREEHLASLAKGRKKLSKLQKNSDFVMNQTAAIRAQWSDPKRHEDQAQRLSNLWKNPEFRARQTEISRARIIAYNKQRASLSA